MTNTCDPDFIRAETEFVQLEQLWAVCSKIQKELSTLFDFNYRFRKNGLRWGLAFLRKNWFRREHMKWSELGFTKLRLMVSLSWVLLWISSSAVGMQTRTVKKSTPPRFISCLRGRWNSIGWIVFILEIQIHKMK